MAQSVRAYKSRLETLKRDRANWDALWQAVAKVIYPRRQDFTTEVTPGTLLTADLYNSVGVHSNSLLAAGLNGMLTNMATEWFTLRLANEKLENEPGVHEWLFDTTKIMMTEMNSPKAGMHTALNEVYHEFSAFGTAMMGVFDDPERKGVRFEARPLSEMFVAENNRGVIDTFYRPFTWTVRQVVQEWGTKAVSEKTRKAYKEEKFDQKVKVLHVLQPRSDFDPSKGPASTRNMMFESVYVELETGSDASVEGGVILAESGFSEQPLLGPRFAKGAGEVYGRGPGTMALPDVRMVNSMQKTVLEAAQLNTRPPLFAPNDGSIGSIRMVPGGLNIYQAGMSDKIFHLPPGGNIQIGQAEITALEGRIREMFFVDQLQLNVGPQMTATEVLQRTEEKLRLMGPLLGRVQAELLGPMIDRTFAILLRAKKLPPIPAVLLGQEFVVEYVSPIAKAQKQLQAQGFVRMMDIIQPIIAIDPSILDRLDTAEILKWAGLDLYNMPPKLFRSDDEVDSIQAERQQQQQTQQTVENVQGAGQAAASFAQAAA